MWNNNNAINLAAISGANNDPNFGIRIVSAFHPGTSAYADTNGAALNNSSGNIRFDNVKISGRAVAATPETSPALALGLGVFSFAACALRTRKRARRIA